MNFLTRATLILSLLGFFVALSSRIELSKVPLPFSFSVCSHYLLAFCPIRLDFAGNVQSVSVSDLRSRTSDQGLQQYQFEEFLQLVHLHLQLNGGMHPSPRYQFSSRFLTFIQRSYYIKGIIRLKSANSNIFRLTSVLYAILRFSCEVLGCICTIQDFILGL